MSDEIKFCYKCGANIPEGSDFCPECGASLNRDVNRTEYTAVPSNSAKKGDAGFAPILIMIYGIIAIIAGIIVIAFGMSIDSFLDMMAQAVADGIISDDDYEIILSLMRGINMMTCTLLGILMISSGIFALISGIWSSSLKNWKLSVVFCGVASILPIFSITIDPLSAIILPIVGFLMTYLLYQKKDIFIS